MEMLLMIACISLFGLAVTCLAFGAATGFEQETSEPEREPVPAAAPARFFSDGVAASPIALQPRLPIEALLLQIESHVRLEQAAAESFVESPTPALLRMRTMSPLVQ
jgi:hypothetical protein